MEMLALVWALVGPLISIAEPRYVVIPAGARLYRSRQLAIDEGERSSLPWRAWREQCESGEDSRGEVVSDRDGVTSVRLDSRPTGCRRMFRAFDQNADLVYVPNDSVESDTGDDRTEATSLDVDCPGCRRKSDAYRAVLDATAAQTFMGDAVAKQKSAEKSPEELEEYLACYSTEHQADYNQYYRRLFDLAGGNFQLVMSANGKIKPLLRPEDAAPDAAGVSPTWMYVKPSVLKCVGLRESKWDPTNPSETGAIGLSQLTKVNVDHVDCILHGCTEDDGTVKSPRPWAQTLWANYFRQAKLAFPPAQNPRLWTNPLTKKRCTEEMADKERDAPCPINSIAALALYQLEAEMTVRRESPLHKGDANTDYDDKATFQKSVLTATTNNAGVGTTARAVGRSASPNDWLRHISLVSKKASRRDQISDNTEALKRCLKHGDFRSPWNVKTNQKPRDCTRSRSGKPI